MELVIGVDGGGTRTRLVVAAADGRILGLGEAGCGNPSAGGEAEVRGSLAAARTRAFVQAGLEPRAAAAAFLGLAGVAGEEERRAVERLAVELELAPGDRTAVDHDLRVAQAGAFAGGPGNGSLQGGPRATGGEELRSLLGRLGPRGEARAEVARLAPLVAEAAADGDEVARAILAAGAGELAEAAAAVARALGEEEPAIALVGGALPPGGAYHRAVESALRDHLPAVQLTSPRLTPAGGAVLLAIELL